MGFKGIAKKLAWTTLGLFLILGLTAFFSRNTPAYKAYSYQALQWAATGNHSLSAKLMLAAGAPASPNDEMVPWYYFSMLTDTPLHYAAKFGNLELARRLVEKGAALDWCCCSCVTPLHRAVIAKKTEMVRFLLDAGADPKRYWDLKLSTLDLAKTQGAPEIVALLQARQPRSKNSNAPR